MGRHIAGIGLALALLAGCDDGGTTPEADVADVVDVAGEDATADTADVTEDAAEPDADAADAFDPNALEPTWTALDEMPRYLWGSLFVPAPDLNILLGFGGVSAPLGGEHASIWTYPVATGTWGQSDLPGAPPARYCHCLTAMPERGELLVIGGRTLDGPLAPGAWVYEWKTATWHEVTGEVPKGTIGCHAGWLPALQRGRAVVFGGQGTTVTDPGGMELTTWLFDPATRTFSTLQTATVPPGRRDGATASDVAGGRVLIWGGQTQGFPTPDHTDDLWAFDGTDWSEVPAKGGPGPRRYPAAAFDPAKRLWVLFGGTLETYDEGDLWLFDAATDTWRELDATGAPSARAFAGMAYDAGSDAYYMFGGATSMIGKAFREAWRLELRD